MLPLVARERGTQLRFQRRIRDLRSLFSWLEIGYGFLIVG